MVDETIELKFKKVLKNEKLKFTPQRLLVLEEVIANTDHRECEEIYLSIKNKGNVISRATVYRTIDILHANGFVRKLDIGDGRSRYESKINSPHHDHIICIDCGTIIEFVNDDIERIQDEICKEKKFRLIRHIHQLFGICSNCNEKDKY